MSEERGVHTVISRVTRANTAGQEGQSLVPVGRLRHSMKRLVAAAGWGRSWFRSQLRCWENTSEHFDLQRYQ